MRVLVRLEAVTTTSGSVSLSAPCAARSAGSPAITVWQTTVPRRGKSAREAGVRAFGMCVG